MPGFPRLAASYDLVVIGGGHAGLQAGLKAALLGHSAAVIDRGPKYARSYYAPRMDNIPGFPDGISGHKLLDLQIAAIRKVDARTGYFTPARAEKVARSDAGYEVTFDWLKQTHVVRGRALVLAMGVVDRIPEVHGKIDPIFPWANQALVDFCILCDGHDLGGKSIAVIGHDAFAARTALDLLHFEPTSVTMLTHGRRLLDGVPDAEAAGLRAALAEHGIGALEGEMAGFDELREKRFGVTFTDGSHASFDRGFSALGWYDMHAAFPRALGCRFDADGYVVTDEDCRALDAATGAPIPGLYVVGDQRNGWNQIPEAWATAERAVIHAYAEYL
ncbi:MAG TPA: NAD(P)/FAD-dependent oxidoreductase [Thermoplasmata archaeon]|nr:NAD(P)/FAD-dependent oxidoreductase [Thermoplasmata archaeon]